MCFIWYTQISPRKYCSTLYSEGSTRYSSTWTRYATRSVYLYFILTSMSILRISAVIERDNCIWHTWRILWNYRVQQVLVGSFTFGQSAYVIGRVFQIPAYCSPSSRSVNMLISPVIFLSALWREGRTDISNLLGVLKYAHRTSHIFSRTQRHGPYPRSKQLIVDQFLSWRGMWRHNTRNTWHFDGHTVLSLCVYICIRLTARGSRLRNGRYLAIFITIEVTVDLPVEWPLWLCPRRASFVPMPT